MTKAIIRRAVSAIVGPNRLDVELALLACKSLRPAVLQAVDLRPVSAGVLRA